MSARTIKEAKRFLADVRAQAALRRCRAAEHELLRAVALLETAVLSMVKTQLERDDCASAFEAKAVRQ